MDERSDQDLLLLARSDPAAFGVVYRRHVAAVQAYFRRRTGSADVAFDLTAETFAAALRSLARFEPREEQPGQAWLFGIARHVLAESARRGVVEDRARRALAMEPIVLDDEALRALEHDADRPALRALDDLPDEQREAILARHVDELEYAEIAQRLRCSESVVRQRVSRGLRVLRTRLKEANND